MPNRKSAGLVHHVTMDNNIGEIIVKSASLNILTVKFNNDFLNSKSSLLDNPKTYKKHNHKLLTAQHNFYDHYFIPQLYNDVEKL